MSRLLLPVIILCALTFLCVAAIAQTPRYIDLLVVYTDVFAGWIPSEAERLKFINAPIPAANQVLANNELNAELRIVGTYQAKGYVEVGNSALSNYVSNADGGKLDEVAGKRDEVGADLVIFLSTTATTPGLAAGTGEPVPDPAYRIPVHALVRSDSWNTDYVFLHEVGHLMGLCHSVRDMPNCDNPKGNAYRDGVFTVMVELNPTGTIPYFSSATRLVDGKPIGNSTKADAEGVLTTMIPIVEAYRKSTVPVSPVAPPGC